MPHSAAPGEGVGTHGSSTGTPARQGDAAAWTQVLCSRNVVFSDGDGLEVAPGWVAFSGGKIAALGRGEPPEFAGTIDYGERLIAPAFVNAHTHCALHALRGFVGEATKGNVVEDLFYRFESQLGPSDVAAFARIGAYEALLSGVGLVWDHYFFGEELAGALAEVGLCAVVAPTLEDRGGPAMERWEAQLAATEAIDSSAALAEQGIVAALGPHATDTVSAELWERAMGIAEARNLPLHAHLAQSPEEVQRSVDRDGLTPTRWLQKLGVFERTRSVFAHALYVDRQELGLLGEQTLVCCPYSQLQFGFPARVDVWSEAGVPWVLATDCAASNDSMSLRKELRFAAGQRTVGTGWSETYEQFLEGKKTADDVWALRSERYGRFNASPECLLPRAWGIAGALHPKIKAGVLEAGALANVVVYDLDHPAFWPGKAPLSSLAFADVDGAIHALWTAGRRIGQDGDFAASILRSDAYREHRQDADERFARLAGPLLG